MKLHVNFLAINTLYKQQNLIMTIGELKFIVRTNKGSSATHIINEKRARNSSILPLINCKKTTTTTFMGCVTPTNNFRFFA